MWEMWEMWEMIHQIWNKQNFPILFNEFDGYEHTPGSDILFLKRRYNRLNEVDIIFLKKGKYITEKLIMQNICNHLWLMKGDPLIESNINSLTIILSKYKAYQRNKKLSKIK
jgi:hypothetical protein